MCIRDRAWKAWPPAKSRVSDPTMRKSWADPSLSAGGSALAVALVLVGGFAAYAYYSGRLGHVSIRLPGQAAPADSDGPAQDFLIVGSDTRDFAGAAWPGRRIETWPSRPL